MKNKRYERYCELSGMGVTKNEFTGIELFMEVEEIINETNKAYSTLETIISDYHSHEAKASTETKLVMLINKWESPFIACNELVKRIELNEVFLKNICKANGTTLKKIGYEILSKKARDLLQQEQNK
ncbi:MAG: hypothetical protein IKF66_01220 [Methanobrevibacter sp.]|nr:hypothetical protein [Methanobrevibacter sp.]